MPKKAKEIDSVKMHSKINAYIQTLTNSEPKKQEKSGNITITTFLVPNTNYSLQHTTNSGKTDLQLIGFSGLTQTFNGSGADFVSGLKYTLPILNRNDELISWFSDDKESKDSLLLKSIIKAMATEFPVILNVFSSISTWSLKEITTNFYGFDSKSKRMMYKMVIKSVENKPGLIQNTSTFTFSAKDAGNVLISCAGYFSNTDKEVDFNGIKPFVLANMKIAPSLQTCYRELEQRIDKILIMMG